MKKDPGIPNLFPYKDRILHEIEEKRRIKEDDAAKRREQARQRQAATNEDPLSAEADDRPMGEATEGEVGGDDGPLNDVSAHETRYSSWLTWLYEQANPLAALLASATERATDFEQQNGGDSDMSDEGSDNEANSRYEAQRSRGDSSRKAYDKMFKEVVQAADVILYILDARDPEGTRSKEVEELVTAAEGSSKRLILILNKIDLVPTTVLKGWLTYLRSYFPVLPLRASTSAPNARAFDHRQLTVKGTSEVLFRALKSYAASKQLKRAISVGVIGYPNVGKSSVINVLNARLGGRSTSCPVGAEAGVTKSIRQVKLDNKLKLLDSPGIIFPSGWQGSESANDRKARLILLNSLPHKEVGDPTPAVTLLLRRLAASPEEFAKLLEVYGLPALMTAADGDMTNDFLVQVARKRGRLGKGGVPNLASAAQTVLTDWRDGRIRGWMEPPMAAATTVEGADRTLQPHQSDRKEVVKEWAAEFKLEGLWENENGTAGDDNAAQPMIE